MMSSRILVMACRRALVASSRGTPVRAFSQIYDTGSVTYSGGQATDGQGGYYGSGGARKKVTDEPHRPELLALATDVEHVHQVMQEVADLEELLDEDINKSMEARSSIKKLMTTPDFMETLERLECIKGEPVWGLNQEERELIQAARNKVNDC